MSTEELGSGQVRPCLSPLALGEANSLAHSTSNGDKTRSETNVPVDQRDRVRLRGELDRNFFVEAGAGTGKTTELVSRIVSLVASGHLGVDKLAAITFTEAAAAELRERVRHGLEKASDNAHDEMERERCRRAAREIDLATIQTVHAFAGTLLRTFPIEARLPPGFAVWDQIQSDLAFGEQFRTWLYDEVPSHRREDLPRRDAVRRALLLGMTFDHLRGLARALQDQADLLDRTTSWPAPKPGDALSVARRWGVEILKLCDLLRLAKNGREDNLARHVIDLQPSAARLASAQDETNALLALQSIVIKTGIGNQSGWALDPNGVNACKRIKDCLRTARDEINGLLAEHRAAVLASLLRYLRDFTLDVAEQRRQQGVATFHDLLTWARDLLRDDLDVRAQAQRRFDRIFVDEFQDTDPLQAEIVWFLAADPEDSPPSDWRDVRLAPGKLFVVGDPKQSIYRFRRADIALYSRIFEQAIADERAGLVQNFRSVPPVLQWVNYHFRQHMQQVSGVQAAYVDLCPSEPAIDLNGARWGVYRVGDRIDGNAELVRATEADVVARIAHQVIADGWLVRDANGGLRRACRRDICVLMPTRRNVRGLEDALERYGVPYRMESGSLVLATQEVRDLLACLRAIDDPSDQVALVAALRSPAYGCSDVDLLRWVEDGGKLDYEQPRDDRTGLVADALSSLRRFHAARARRSPAATIEAVIRERMLAVQTFGQPRPREAWRRIRYVVAQARLFARDGRDTLRAFVDWIEGLQRIDVPDTESPLPEPDDDAVRLLTIHGAKGLEFPIVILTGLGTLHRNRPQTVSLLTDRETGAIEVHVGEFQTNGYEAAKQRETNLEIAERVRLLYVAATRARDHLVLCLYRGKDACYASRIAETLDGCDHPLCHSLDVAEPRADGVAESHSIDDLDSSEPDKHAAEERQWLETRRALINELAVAPIVTPTDIVRQFGSEARRDEANVGPPGVNPAGLPADSLSSPGLSLPKVSETSALMSPSLLTVDHRSSQPVASKRHEMDSGDDGSLSDDLDSEGNSLVLGASAAEALGLAVHAVLENVDSPDDPRFGRLAEQAGRRFGIADQVETVQRLARVIAASAIVREAFSSHQFWREVPVGVEVDGVLLEGRIDLLWKRSDGTLAIVDYKTDDVDRDTVAARADQYRLQGGAYALAVERATGKKVSLVAIVFGALDGHAEVYHEIPALTAETREAMRR